MRKKLDQSLDKLYVDFHFMGGLVVEQIQMALTAFLNHDEDLARKVKASDGRINQMDDEIEQKCVNLIALQAPVTNDLRRIIAIMKASTDLERMGDHSKSLAKASLKLVDYPRDYAIEQMLNDMGRDVIAATKKTLNAFTKEDYHTAELIEQEDDIIDDKRDDLIDTCISAMTAQPDLVPAGTEYIRIANFLERLGDYATNVSEWILYLES